MFCALSGIAIANIAAFHWDCGKAPGYNRIVQLEDYVSLYLSSPTVGLQA